MHQSGRAERGKVERIGKDAEGVSAEEALGNSSYWFAFERSRETRIARAHRERLLGSRESIALGR